MVGLRRRMDSTPKGLRLTVGLRRPKDVLGVDEGQRPARNAFRGRFQSARSLDGQRLTGRRPKRGLLRPSRSISEQPTESAAWLK
jgi:hypothetical protein